MCYCLLASQESTEERVIQVNNLCFSAYVISLSMSHSTAREKRVLVRLLCGLRQKKSES